MGKVWQSHHTALKGDEALKVLPDALSTDPERLARFEREAENIARAGSYGAQGNPTRPTNHRQEDREALWIEQAGGKSVHEKHHEGQASN